MELIIVTPSGKQVHAVSWVEINTPTGNYVIQPGHVPTAFTLSANKPLVYSLTNGKQASLMIENAIVDVSRTSVLVLMNK